MNTEGQKEKWYKRANMMEDSFVAKYGQGLSLKIHPLQKTNGGAGVDLVYDKGLADLKNQREPFYLSEKKFGIPPLEYFSLNVEDFMQYCIEQPDNFRIYVWTVYEPSSAYGVSIPQYEAVHMSDMYNLKLGLGYAKVHQYLRRVDRTDHAKMSYAIDLRTFKRLI